MEVDETSETTEQVSRPVNLETGTKNLKLFPLSNIFSLSEFLFEIFGKFCGLLYIVDSVKRVCHSLIVFLFVCLLFFFFLAILAYIYSKRNVYFIKIFVKIKIWNFCQVKKQISLISIKDSQNMSDNLM